MYATERQQLIERAIADHGRVAVVDLATRFDVTTETVRRDLAVLEERGALRRVHGGAVALTRSSTVEVSVAERAGRQSDAKLRIARRALDGFGAGSLSVYLDAGTTTAALATLLSDRATTTGDWPEIVTHSMAVAQLLAAHPAARLTAIGGRVRGLTAAAVGPDAVAAVDRLRPDVAFVGTNGISAAFGLSTPDPDEAAVKRAVVRAARRVVVLADSEKLDAELLVTFAALDAVDVLVTDREPAAALAQALRDAEVEVWIA